MSKLLTRYPGLPKLIQEQSPPSTFPSIPTRPERAKDVLTSAGENRLAVFGKFKAKVNYKDKVSDVVSPLCHVLLGLLAL